ncbi:substrate-binding domain-containing protein [Pseudactinotalea suaedae]|uniref:substrate-binding domain-containing protein n=1 Tax=Pseudactinotalea suaedae TaxID=1524924 RepID=UPI0019D65110|nr:substrate-binding domain-containing protein [Pseudactinotalea suaedae]
MARRRGAAAVALDASEARSLREAASGTGAEAVRARVVLLAAEGRSNTEIAAIAGVARQSVVSWRRRYAADGMAGLRDRRRSGRPPRVDAWRIVLASLTAPEGADRWTSRSLAASLGVGAATVVRAWQAHGVQPLANGRLRLLCEPPLEVDVLEEVDRDDQGVTLRPHPRGERLRLVPPEHASSGTHVAPSTTTWRGMARVVGVLHDRTSEATRERGDAAEPARRTPNRPDTYEAPSSARVTMREVAADAGVSMKTVSNVLTGAKRVAPDTRARVEQSIDRLGYQLNTAARHLRTGRRGTVVLAVPEFRVNYFAELAEQLIDAAAARGVTIQVQVTRGQRERELEIMATARGLADGVIMVGQGMTEADLRGLSGGGPFVLLGENISGTAVDHITISNAGAARTAMTHLLASGRRRVALLGTGSTAVAAARVRGAREAAAEHGVELLPELMVGSGPWHRDAGERATAELIESGAVFDAILGFNDELALGAARALLTHGIDVPTDVALVGFDNSRDAAYSTPSLTSIAPDMAHIARRALELIEERQRHPGVGRGAEPAHVIAPHTLAVRESAP